MTSQLIDLSQTDRESILYPLLAHLDNRPADGPWQDWQIEAVSGGANNILYRAAGERGTVAVKFTIRDARDRAGREYQTLLAFEQAGLDLAPRPLLLDRERFSQPVVVQSWLNGPVSRTPPQTETTWRRLLDYFVALRVLTPARTGLTLRPGLINANSPQVGLALLQQQIAYVPLAERRRSLLALAAQIETLDFPAWSPAPVTICRIDANITNFIQRPGTWASVDWENSGWGDPAFEIADLVTHPAYTDVPLSRWQWVMATYCRLVDDPTVVTRIRVYYLLMLAWWVARVARFLYEVPRGQDQRLVTRPSGWLAGREEQYQHYLDWAWQIAEADWGLRRPR